MKKILLFILLLTNYVMAQQAITKESLQKEFEELRVREQASHSKMFGPDGAGGANGIDFTVASSNFDIHHMRLEWSIDPAIKYIAGKCSYDFTMVSAGNNIVFDLLNSLTVDSVWYHGNKISFQQTATHGVVINFPATINAGIKDSVSIFYRGIPSGLTPSVFYRGTQSGVPVIYTLSEPYGAREWWPCKNNLTDKSDSVDIIITSPSTYQPSSNGVLISNDIVGPNRVSHFRHRYPITPYLVAVAVTNYVLNDDTVRVGNNVYPWQSFFYPSNNAFHKSRETFAKTAYRIFSQLFTLYPFANEKYGHTQWDWNGGMEHQTNSFMLNTGPNLSAHELGHQWFGDYITCKSWQHIWLNEGFATYCTLLFLQYGFPDFYKPQLDATHNNIVSDSTGSVFVADTSTSARIFDSRLSYNKGAYLLHMLRGSLGDSAFFRGVRRYLNDPAVKLNYAMTADLQRNLEAESGKNLNSFFQKWFYGEGYPNYYAEWSQNANNFTRIKLNQTTSHPSVSFFDMPVRLVLKGASQSKPFVVDHKFSGQEFILDAGFVVDTVLIDPDFWILSKIRKSVKVAGNTTPNDVKIYPNPSIGPIHVSLSNPTDKQLQLRIFNSIGQLVYRRDLELTGRDELIDVPSTVFARGTYVLELRSEKSIKLTRKIVRR